MGEPISARFASSFSRNGINEAATTQLFLVTSRNASRLVRQIELTGLPRGRALLNDFAVLVDLDRSLTDRVAVFFPRRKIERIRFVIRRLAAIELLVCAVNGFLGQVIPDVEFGVSRRRNSNVIDHAPALDFAIRRFNKAELVDPGEANSARSSRC